jgi:hypothetical protein
MDDYPFIEEIDGDVYVESQDKGRYVGIEGIFELFVDPEMDADGVANLFGLEEIDVRNAVRYWTEEPGVYEELVESTGVSPGSFESTANQTLEADEMLEPVSGYDHIARDNMDGIVLKDYEESEEGFTATVSGDLVFADLFEDGRSAVESAEKHGLKIGQVEEVREYVEESTENLHELARISRGKNSMIDEASGSRIEDMMERALDDGEGEMPIVNYEGVLGDLQELVEEEVDERGFRIRYDPGEDQLYRDAIEMHVLPDEDSEDEFYFGIDSEKTLFFGSTVTEADKIVHDVDGSEEFVRQELDALAMAEEN